MAITAQVGVQATPEKLQGAGKDPGLERVTRALIPACQVLKV